MGLNPLSDLVDQGGAGGGKKVVNEIAKDE